MSYQGLYKAIQEGEGWKEPLNFFPRKENIILTAQEMSSLPYSERG